MKWNNGDVVHGFNIMKVDHVEEVNSDVYMMEHIKSGAKLMYLDLSLIHISEPKRP